MRALCALALVAVVAFQASHASETTKLDFSGPGLSSADSFQLLYAAAEAVSEVNAALGLPADSTAGLDDPAPPRTEEYAVVSQPVVTKADGGELPYFRAGPCPEVFRLRNEPLRLSPSSTGCMRTQCTIRVHATVPENCAALPGPYPTIVIFGGYEVKARFYDTIADRLATWGYSVIQYDRPYNGAIIPPSEQETAYFPPILGWAAGANATQGSPLYGAFSAKPGGIIGHSMGGGLASIVAGDNPERVAAVVLLDPVDYTQLSRRVARQYLNEYAQPALLVDVGVRCVDRTKCAPPQDHQPTAREDLAWSGCRPDWWCCDWNTGAPLWAEKGSMTQASDGIKGFINATAPGSTVVRLAKAGHMSFLGPYDQATDGKFSIDCPNTVPNSDVIPDALAVVLAWFDSELRGGSPQALADWAAQGDVRDRVTVTRTGEPVAASASSSARRLLRGEGGL